MPQGLRYNLAAENPAKCLLLKDLLSILRFAQVDKKGAKPRKPILGGQRDCRLLNTTPVLPDARKDHMDVLGQPPRNSALPARQSVGLARYPRR